MCATADCHNLVPLERKRTAIYCSKNCQARTNNRAWRARNLERERQRSRDWWQQHRGK